MFDEDTLIPVQLLNWSPSKEDAFVRLPDGMKKHVPLWDFYGYRRKADGYCGNKYRAINIKPDDMSYSVNQHPNNVRNTNMSDDQNTNPEDDVMARIDELDNTYEGTSLEGFTKDVSETLREKYGPDSPTPKGWNYEFDTSDLPGAMVDMDQERPSKFAEFMESEDLKYYIVGGALVLQVAWDIRTMVKIAKYIKS